MRKRVAFLILSLSAFFMLFLTAKSYQSSLDFSIKGGKELSVLKVPIESLMDARINIGDLNIGTTYLLLLRAEVQSNNMQASRLPFFRKAYPQLSGLLKYKINSLIKVELLEEAFNSSILSLISKTIQQASSKRFFLNLPFAYWEPHSSEDFIELNLSLTKGALSGSTIEFYPINSFSEVIFFYPRLLLYAGFLLAMLASSLLMFSIFGLPREHTTYFFIVSLIFGLVGIDALLRGNPYKFLLKFFTIGGLGIIYTFDLGKDFYWLITREV